MTERTDLELKIASDIFIRLVLKDEAVSTSFRYSLGKWADKQKISYDKGAALQALKMAKVFVEAINE